jgi:hypothetical protein
MCAQHATIHTIRSLSISIPSLLIFSSIYDSIQPPIHLSKPNQTMTWQPRPHPHPTQNRPRTRTQDHGGVRKGNGSVGSDEGVERTEGDARERTGAREGDDASRAFALDAVKRREPTSAWQRPHRVPSSCARRRERLHLPMHATNAARNNTPGRKDARYAHTTTSTCTSHSTTSTP